MNANHQAMCTAPAAFIVTEVMCGFSPLNSSVYTVVVATGGHGKVSAGLPLKNIQQPVIRFHGLFSVNDK